jgi:hypothetical protein
VPKKKSSKKHLKKKKAKVQTERYDYDDVYDPESEKEPGTKMKRRKFHSINPPT